MRLIIVAPLILLFLSEILFVQPTFAQESYELLKDEIELTRAVIKVKRKKIVAANVNLTKTESKKFWPLYNDYIAEIDKANNKRVKLIAEYRDAYVNKTLSDRQALKLLNGYQLYEQVKLRTRNTFVQKFKEILPPKKVVRFFQVENKLDAIINFELAGGIPLVPVAK